MLLHFHLLFLFLFLCLKYKSICTCCCWKRKNEDVVEHTGSGVAVYYYFVYFFSSVQSCIWYYFTLPFKCSTRNSHSYKYQEDWLINQHLNHWSKKQQNFSNLCWDSSLRRIRWVRDGKGWGEQPMQSSTARAFFAVLLGACENREIWVQRVLQTDERDREDEGVWAASYLRHCLALWRTEENRQTLDTWLKRLCATFCPTQSCSCNLFQKRRQSLKIKCMWPNKLIYLA